MVIGLLWFFTGLAIVLYVNQVNMQPRERDYSTWVPFMPLPFG
jgi:hypothetical protein